MTTIVVLVGAFASGKSTLLEALDTGQTYYPPVTIIANIRKIKDLVFYDLSGGNQFQLMVQSLIEKASIILYCVDLSSPMALFYHHLGPFHVPVILIFTKSDLPCLYNDFQVQTLINDMNPVDILSVSIAADPIQARVVVLNSIHRLLLPHENKQRGVQKSMWTLWASWFGCCNCLNFSHDLMEPLL
jgi:hypothetical protein